ncbi:MAG: hypothetical protein WC333_00115 [Dehalococcoidia bacterium]|jgi:hypothetical protein
MDYIFKLDPDQIERLEAWQKKIKKKHGEYGTFTYSFTPVGMGTGVKIYSHKADKILDLSDVDKW